MIKKLDAKLALLLTVVAALVVLLVGWFGLVSTERSKASQTDTQVAEQQVALTAAQSLIATTSKAAADAQLRAAERVLPTDPRMSQVVRQLTAYSGTSSTQIDSIVPGAVTTVGTAQAVPVTLTIEGQYFAIRHFLALLQAGASMKKDKVTGNGRLYSVDKVQFVPSPSTATTPGTSGASASKQPPNTLNVTVSLNVFIAGAPAPVAPAPTSTDSSSTSSDTTTTASSATP